MSAGYKQNDSDEILRTIVEEPTLVYDSNLRTNDYDDDASRPSAVYRWWCTWPSRG